MHAEDSDFPPDTVSIRKARVNIDMGIIPEVAMCLCSIFLILSSFELRPAATIRGTTQLLSLWELQPEVLRFVKLHSNS
jgi:hypothetical protein